MTVIIDANLGLFRGKSADRKAAADRLNSEPIPFNPSSWCVSCRPLSARPHPQSKPQPRLIQDNPRGSDGRREYHVNVTSWCRAVNHWSLERGGSGGRKAGSKALEDLLSKWADWQVGWVDASRVINKPSRAVTNALLFPRRDGLVRKKKVWTAEFWTEWKTAWQTWRS